MKVPRNDTKKKELKKIPALLVVYLNKYKPFCNPIILWLCKTKPYNTMFFP